MTGAYDDPWINIALAPVGIPSCWACAERLWYWPGERVWYVGTLPSGEDQACPNCEIADLFRSAA